MLLAFYSLGLGMPFILAALAWRRALGAISLRPPAPAVGDPRRRPDAGRWSGLLLLTGWWDQSVQWLQYHLVDDFQVSV